MGGLPQSARESKGTGAGQPAEDGDGLAPGRPAHGAQESSQPWQAGPLAARTFLLCPQSWPSLGCGGWRGLGYEGATQGQRPRSAQRPSEPGAQTAHHLLGAAGAQRGKGTRAPTFHLLDDNPVPSSLHQGTPRLSLRGPGGQATPPKQGCVPGAQPVCWERTRQPPRELGPSSYLGS